jgi:DNA-binding transcriptional regulator GbsR (MarR family)
MNMTPARERFILHWGEMGPRWGVAPSVAQVHALLYLSPKPLSAEEIATQLSIARSNVSTSLKELQNWGIVRVRRVLGDRREHFESLSDVWEMFRIVFEERKRRELDPTLVMLQACLHEARNESGPEAKITVQRVGDMLSFFETMSTWYEQMSGMPMAAAKSFMKMGRKLRSILGSGS